VSSQSDTEKADLAREKNELITDPDSEREELARIYVSRGVSAPLAQQVADELMARDALGAHSRDELGISEAAPTRPLQAAGASAASFTVGALLPVLVAAVASELTRASLVAASALVSLAALGIVGARIGGARPFRPALRVTVWGAIAMTLTAAIGKAIGAVV